MQHPLFSSYFGYLQNECKRPASVQAFLNLSDWDDEFPFQSFREWENEEMRVVFLKTKTLLQSDLTFSSYTSREKVLAIFYTWLEILGEYKDFFTELRRIQSRAATSQIWGGVKHELLEWMEELVDEGIGNREIANRPFITQWYNSLIWTQAVTILAYWEIDDSEELVRTDALIEKSINFLFDLIQPNALDSGWDLITFFAKRS